MQQGSNDVFFHNNYPGAAEVTQNNQITPSPQESLTKQLASLGICTAFFRIEIIQILMRKK